MLPEMMKEVVVTLRVLSPRWDSNCEVFPSPVHKSVRTFPFLSFRCARSGIRIQEIKIPTQNIFVYVKKSPFGRDISSVESNL